MNRVRPCLRVSFGHVFVGVLLSVSACTSAKNKWGPDVEYESNRQLSFAVKVGADANDNTPIAMSVVVTYEKDIQKAVAAMSAQQWFLARKQFMKDRPKNVHEFMYESVPGQTVRPVVTKIHEGVAKGYVFVNYKSVGVWRYEFDPDKPIRINFGKDTLSVVQD
jgi:hypothetical protein